LDLNYLKDETLINTLRDIGIQIKQCEYMKECNEVGLEYGSFDQDLDLRRLKLRSSIDELIEHIKENY
jgi:hypothetical protein